MNYSTLEAYSYTTPLRGDSSYCEWQGQRSSKFPPTIRHLPRSDLIKTSTSRTIQISRCRIRRQREAGDTSSNLLIFRSLFALLSTRCRPLSTGACAKVPSELSISNPSSTLPVEKCATTTRPPTTPKPVDQPASEPFTSQIKELIESTVSRTGCSARQGSISFSSVVLFSRAWMYSRSDTNNSSTTLFIISIMFLSKKTALSFGKPKPQEVKGKKVLGGNSILIKGGVMRTSRNPQSRLSRKLA